MTLNLKPIHTSIVNNIEIFKKNQILEFSLENIYIKENYRRAKEKFKSFSQNKKLLQSMSSNILNCQKFILNFCFYSKNLFKEGIQKQKEFEQNQQILKNQSSEILLQKQNLINNLLKDKQELISETTILSKIK